MLRVALLAVLTMSKLLLIGFLCPTSLAQQFDVIEGEDPVYSVNFGADLEVVLLENDKLSQLKEIYPKRYWSPVARCFDGHGKECKKLYEFGVLRNKPAIAFAAAQKECEAKRAPSCQDYIVYKPKFEKFVERIKLAEELEEERKQLEEDKARLAEEREERDRRAAIGNALSAFGNAISGATRAYSNSIPAYRPSSPKTTDCVSTPVGMSCTTW